MQISLMSFLTSDLAATTGRLVVTVRAGAATVIVRCIGTNALGFEARTVDGSSLACPGRFRPAGALGGRPGSAQWCEAAGDVRAVYRLGAAGDCPGARRSQDA